MTTRICSLGAPWRPKRRHSGSHVDRFSRHMLICIVFVLLACRLVESFLPGVRCPCRPIRPAALWAKSGTKKKKPKDNTISVNRLAYRNYEIVDTIEAGISLLGTEVKSIRDGKMNIRDGFVRPSKDGRSCTLFNVHIGKHTMSGEYFQHEERRPRTLLLHKEEALKLLKQTEQQGMTIIPLKAYFNEKNRIKLQIALCRGKNVRDKRKTIQEREAKRDDNRIIKNFRLG